MSGLKIALMLVGMLAVVQQSEQFNLKSIKSVSQETKPFKDTTPYFGLIFTSDSTEKALNESGFFNLEAYVDYHGRRFVAGTIYGAPVVYIKSQSTPSIHVGISVQLLAVLFDLRGIISFGTAGATNDTVSLGSVVVPKQFAFTGAWNWLSYNESVNGDLVFGNWNYPKRGENLLGSVSIEESYIYKDGVDGTQLWIPVDPDWLQYASKVEIDDCDIIVGLNGSCSDIYVNNLAYREFLYKTFRVSTVDTSSAAAAFGALGNNLKFIAFKGISNKAGAGSGESKSELANANVVKVVAKFIWLLTVPRAQHE